VIALLEFSKKKDLKPCGEEILLMSLDISPLKLLTSHSKIFLRRLSILITPKLTDSNFSSEILPQEVLLVPAPFASSILLISPEPDLLLMLDQENKDNLMDLLTVLLKFSLQMD